MDIEPYYLPDPMPWAVLAGPLTEAEDAVARLDERIAKSPIREGWIARTHFADAADSLWIEGELVHIEDLVLHDAQMDVRSPTHELTRAHAVLRTRRRIASEAPGWALSRAGLDSLRGRDVERPAGSAQGTKEGVAEDDDLFSTEEDDDDPLRAEFAALDAAMGRANELLKGEGSSTMQRDPFVYDTDWDEEGRLDRWIALIREARSLPPVLAAAVTLDAWSRLEPLPQSMGLGSLFAASLLRDRGKTQAFLFCFNSGLRAVARERRRSSDRVTRLLALIESVKASAARGMSEHDRWLLARRQLERKLIGRRSTSKLPELIDLAISRPIVSAGVIAKNLGVTARAAQDLVALLGLREATGRARYRGWAIL